jgi:hypothetical protein
MIKVDVHTISLDLTANQVPETAGTGDRVVLYVGGKKYWQRWRQSN